MFIAITILFSYLIAMVFAGHGAGPMGVVLIYSLLDLGKSYSDWNISEIAVGQIATMVGWAGIIGLISATFLLRSNPSKRISYQFLFCVILYLSWLGAAAGGIDGSDYSSLQSSFALSTPFHITFLFVVGRIFFERLMMSED